MWSGVESRSERSQSLARSGDANDRGDLREAPRGRGGGVAAHGAKWKKMLYLKINTGDMGFRAGEELHQPFVGRVVLREGGLKEGAGTGTGGVGGGAIEGG